MRQLHPVSFHERFVASGSYVYAQDGADTGDVEHWTLHEPGDGGLTLRADYDGRSGSGVNWLFEGFYLREKRRFERFDLSLLGPQRTDAKFVFTADEAQISLRIDGVARERIDIALPPDCAVWPLALAGLGLLDVQQAEMPLFVPALRVDTGLVQGGVVETLRITALPPEALSVDTRPYDAHAYGFTMWSLGEMRLWLDRYTIPLQMQAAFGLTARLTQYVHRPETTS
jgi:hypothetical protein